MPSDKIVTPLRDDWCYHLYNRGVNRARIFFHKDNYELFLKLSRRHLSSRYEIIAYCLIPNHFHLVIKVRSEFLRETSLAPPLRKANSEGLRRLFIAYAKAVNLEQGRVGPVFCRPFRRIAIRTDEQMKYLIHYVHNNPIKHKLCREFHQYPYSSYKAYLTQDSDFVAIGEGLGYFDSSLGKFLDEHEQQRQILLQMLEVE